MQKCPVQLRHHCPVAPIYAKRKIDINKATEILVSKKLEEFEKYPLRKNKMIIICAEGEVEYSDGYDGDFEEDELPNDQQLLSYI